MKISVIGSGYVGLVSGACFAAIGHDVVCVDNDPLKIALLESGGVPIFEPGLDILIATNVEEGRLRFTTDINEAVNDCDAIYIAVGTPPSASGGQADLRFVYAVAREIAPSLRNFTAIIIKSTVPVGTGDEVEQIIREMRPDADIAVVSNPEFLREGSAIEDFMRPDRIVVGSDDARAEAMVREIYRPITAGGHEFVVMDRRGAELAKYAANAFLAAKIAYINQIADLCEKVGTDVCNVARAVGLDNRIGPRFLEAGPGFGGSCFPKDTAALIHMGEKHGAPQKIVQAVISSNDERKRKLGERILEALGRPEGKTVCVLGLSFKAGTDDLRDSPSVAIIEILQRAGVTVNVSDPQGLRHADSLACITQTFADPYEALEGADAVVVATEWEEFRNLDLGRVARLMRGTIVADLRNIYPQADLDAAGLTHLGIGRPDKLAQDAQPVGSVTPLFSWSHGPAVSHGSAVAGNKAKTSLCLQHSDTDRAKKTVLITGGAGFLGSHLAERLVAEGHLVYCLDNLHTGRVRNINGLISTNRLIFVEHDLIDPLPLLPRFDEIYNLACPASPVHYQSDPVATLRVCSDGVMNVLRRAAQDGAALFHTSTSEVYGDPEVHPQHEAYHGNVNPVGPRSCYDEGKRFAETLMTDYSRQNGVRLRMVRIFNTYGPRMLPNDGRVVSNFIVEALRGEPITIYGNGRQTRSFCYVDDLIDGFLALMAADDDALGPMNIGNPAELTVAQLAEIIVEMTGSRSEIVYHPLPIDDPQRRRPDITRASQILGWSPKVDLKTGLRKTVDYFREEIETADSRIFAESCN